MDNKKNGIPKLRFPGFTGAWEQRKLGEVMDVGSVKRIHQSDWKTEGVRFLRARDIVSFSKNEKPSDLLYIDNSKYNEYSKISGKVQKGDLLVTGVGSIGVPMLIKSNDPIYFKDGNIIWFKNNNSLNGNFFYYSFTSNKIQNFIRKSSGAGTVGTYTIDNGKKTPILIPKNIDEQEKVGKFLSRFDALIALHQRKLEHLQEQKKGLLQKMFPKNGETVPEVRFPGFTDAWEQRKLGEVVERFDNLRIPVTSSKREKGITPYYGANGIQDYVQGYTHDGEFVLVAEDGANDLQNYPVHYVNGKVWVNNHAHVLQGKKDIADNLFLVNAIKRIKFETYLVGGSRAKLNADVMMKLPIKVPTLNEQQKLGKYFSRIDSLIALHQRKLEHLELMKKGLLQQMFV